MGRGRSMTTALDRCLMFRLQSGKGNVNHDGLFTEREFLQVTCHSSELATCHIADRGDTDRLTRPKWHLNIRA
jgi:hypothetical protein